MFAFQGRLMDRGLNDGWVTMPARYMQRTKDLAMKWGEWAVLSTALGLYALCSPAVTHGSECLPAGGRDGNTDSCSPVTFPFQH